MGRPAGRVVQRQRYPDRAREPVQAPGVRTNAKGRAAPIVASGVFSLPAGIELSPILQWATARPYSVNTGFDLDGDGLTTLDRICEGVDARAYNLFDTENVSFAERRGLSPATSTTLFMQPFSLYGPGFGPPVGRPLTLRLGARVDF